MLAHLAALSATLCDLDLFCDDYGYRHIRGRPTAQALTSMAALTHLTRLRIRPCIEDCDPPSLDILATAWPRLASFDLGCILPNNTLLDAFATALARRTALTSLSLASRDLPPDLAAALTTNLRHLHISADVTPSTIRALTPLASALAALTRLRNHGIGIVVALAPSAVGAPLPSPGRLTAVTHLSIVGHTPLGSDTRGILPPLARNRDAPDTLDVLAPLAPTLRHLYFSGVRIPFLALQPLSHLTGLRSLDLRDRGMSSGEDCGSKPSLYMSRTTPYQQAARRIGTALSHLTSLSMQPTAWPADTLLAAVAAHGRLRHVSVSAHIPRIAECLAPASRTLTRLHCFLHRSLNAIATLADLEALQCLSCQFVSTRGCDSLGLAPLPRAAAATAADSNRSAGAKASTAGAGAGALGQVVGVGSSLSPHGQRAADTASVGGRSSSGSSSASSGQRPEGQQQQQHQEQQRGPTRPRLLPRQLRVLCCDLALLLDQEQARQVVEAAAARQECAVCRDLRLPQYDDCNGYLDGAAPEFRRWGDDEVASDVE